MSTQGYSWRDAVNGKSIGKVVQPFLESVYRPTADKMHVSADTAHTISLTILAILSKQMNHQQSSHWDFVSY